MVYRDQRSSVMYKYDRSKSHLPTSKHATSHQRRISDGSTVSSNSSGYGTRSSRSYSESYSSRGSHSYSESYSSRRSSRSYSESHQTDSSNGSTFMDSEGSQDRNSSDIVFTPTDSQVSDPSYGKTFKTPSRLKPAPTVQKKSYMFWASIFLAFFLALFVVGTVFGVRHMVDQENSRNPFNSTSAAMPTTTILIPVTINPSPTASTPTPTTVLPLATAVALPTTAASLQGPAASLPTSTPSTSTRSSAQLGSNQPSIDALSSKDHKTARSRIYGRSIP